MLVEYEMLVHSSLRQGRHLWYKIIPEGLGQKERLKNSIRPLGRSPSPDYQNVPEGEQFRVEQFCS